jgi:hypothetical protein
VSELNLNVVRLVGWIHVHFVSRRKYKAHIIRACLVQLHEQLHEQLHNFNSQTANSLPNSLVSFSENSLSQS